ncbi:MAG: metallophosphoesterase [Bacteroidales bacterium]|nr:metallophosphoesterase [Bacteroidales bacterium]
MLIRVSFYKGFFDTQENNHNIMILNGLMVAVILNMVLIILLHYSGKLFKIRKGGFVKSLTRTGLIISAVIFLVCTYGFLIGKYNFKTEEVTIYFKDLDKGLDGIKIVHISDLHLPAFYSHPGQLKKVIRIINSCQPDLLINTGDFVNYGWREFDSYDTILAKAQARYGSFAILGNHDMGTYLPDSSEEEREFNVLKMCELIESSGYHLLNKDHSIVNIGGSKMALIGVPTSGHFPSLIHSDIKEAAKGLDSTGFKILLCHDPNQWEEEVTGKTNIELTLSGHTHGMQVGILAGRLRWSPAKYFYPNWNGLYKVGDQYQYVNRGLGVLGVPFRIWMSPEISVITLKAE